MIKHLLLIGSLLVSGIASADGKDEWVKYYTNPDGVEYYSNEAKTNKVENSNAQEVNQWLLLKTTKDTAEGDRKGDLTYLKIKIRCDKMEIKNLKFMSYTALFKEHVEDFDDYSIYGKIQPTSPDYKLAQNTCKALFPS